MSTAEKTFTFKIGDNVELKGIQELLPEVESLQDQYNILAYIKSKIGVQGVVYYYNIKDIPDGLFEEWRENKNFSHIIDNVVIARDKLLAAKQYQSDNPDQSQVPPKSTTITGVVEYLNELIPTAPPIELGIFENYHGEYIGNRSLSIPQVPLIKGSKPQPHMLLFDVGNKSHMESAVYKYLTTVKDKGPCALFAVSGGGKTRRVLECLSQNFGFYFLARKSPTDRNPGSGDMNYVVGYLGGTIENLKESTRQFTVQQHMYGLLLGRLLVFQRLKELLGEKLTPYVWMLAQLHPKLIGPEDVFNEVLDMICRKIAVESFEDLYKNLAKEIKQRFHCFVDEAQSLLRVLPRAFSSERSTEKRRSMYSAVLKSLSFIATFPNTVYFPCFSGTGMSADSFKEAVGSAVAKLGIGPTYDETFSSFDMLTYEQVGEYLATLGVIGSENQDEKLKKFYDHGLKWLQGRPRWSATFASLWMRGLIGAGPTEILQSPRSSRNSVGKHPIGDAWLRAVEDYVHLITTKPTAAQKRISGSIVHASAYAIFAALGERVRDQQENTEDDTEVSAAMKLLHGIYQSVMEFAMNGESVRVTDDVFKLIEYGLCAVERNGDEISARLEEPMIVEAGVQYYSNPKSEDPEDTSIAKYFATQLATVPESSSQGFVFEKLLLPFIRAKFNNQTLKDLLEEQGIGIREDVDIGSFSVGLTSYGILAKRCSSPAETMAWIEDSISAEFDGAVPPFCLPDTMMGPDVLNLLRDQEWKTFLPLALQVKLSTNVNQSDAIRSVMPELFYKLNRGKVNETDALEGTELSLWRTLSKTLFEGNVCAIHSMHGLIQFPQKRSKNSVPTIDFKSKRIRVCWDYDNIDKLVGKSVKGQLEKAKKGVKKSKKKLKK